MYTYSMYLGPPLQASLAVQPLYFVDVYVRTYVYIYLVVSLLGFLILESGI